MEEEKKTRLISILSKPKNLLRYTKSMVFHNCVKTSKISQWYLARPTSLYELPCHNVYVYVCSYVDMSVTNFGRRYATSYVIVYGAVRQVLKAPLKNWQNSTPFWCKASLCTLKIDHFRTYHIARAYSTLVISVLVLTRLKLTKFLV